MVSLRTKRRGPHPLGTTTALPISHSPPRADAPTPMPWRYPPNSSACWAYQQSWRSGGLLDQSLPPWFAQIKWRRVRARALPSSTLPRTPRSLPALAANPSPRRPPAGRRVVPDAPPRDREDQAYGGRLHKLDLRVLQRDVLMQRKDPQGAGLAAGEEDNSVRYQYSRLKN